MLPFFLAVWIVMNMDRAFAVLVIVLCATAAGGLARVAATAKFGAPEPALMGIIAFELTAQLFILSTNASFNKVRHHFMIKLTAESRQRRGYW